jgi:hypothetical protein
MSDIETRHSHGNEWHDHPGGNIPHGPHTPGDGAPPGIPPQRGGGVILSAGGLGTGIGVAILGGILMLWQGNNHAACSSGLVQAFAPSQCSNANTIWTLGLLGLIAGIVLFAVTAIVLAIRSSK